MGSITKTPKVPQRSVPVSSSPTITEVAPSPAVEDTGPTESEQAAEAREQSLLRRSRGRLGTVLTGFRGFLNPSNRDDVKSQKTLLGE